MRAMQEGVDRGLFRQEVSPDALPDIATILTTALEVASAMAFLHEHSIVHGDLTGGDICHQGYSQCSDSLLETSSSP